MRYEGVKPGSREYMRLYMRERYHRRRAEFIALRGGRCEVCGGPGPFDIDHRDPSKKELSVGGALASLAAVKLALELEKCQILCKECHLKKTLRERREKGNPSFKSA